MAKAELYHVGRDLAVMCLQRWFVRRFLLERLVISHAVGELREVVISCRQ